MTDQFTRWRCAKCGGDGIDSWNKAIFDGPSWEAGEALPNPWVLGMECWRCMWPCVVSYSEAGAAPRALYGPIASGDSAYEYESAAFQAIQNDHTTSVELLPAASRDCDWSRGCLAARAQLQ